MSNPIYHWFHRHYHTRYHGIYRHAKKLFVFDMILLASSLIIFCAGLFFFFWKPSLTDLIDLKVTLGENRIKSGELIPLAVTYQNRTEFNLSDAVLSVHLPAGFEIERSKTPETEFSNDSIFDLGNIKPGAKGEKVIWGYFWTDVGQEDRITALLSYLPQNRSKREQKIGVLLTNLPDSILKTELTAPTAALPGQEIPITIKVTNQGDKTIYPIDTIVRDQSPGVYLKIQEPMSNLSFAPGETKIFNGSFILPIQPGKFNLTVETSITIKSIYGFNQNKIVSPIDITSLPNFNLKAVWQTPSYLDGGSEIPVEISWKNSGQKELKKSRLRLQISPVGVVDLVTTARSNGWVVEGNDLLMDKTHRTSLTDIKPGNEDKLTTNIKLLPKFNLGDLENVKLEIKPILEGELTDVPGQTVSIAGEAITAPLATEISWETQTRYFTFDGDQLGRGPLPPMVGEPTKYWIFIRINNSSNAIKNTSFSAQLAPGVQFTNKQSVSIGTTIKYDDKTGTIVWEEKSIPANSVTGLYFEVAVSPTPEQIGRALTLIKNPRFTATDDWTGKSFSLTSGDLTNILPTNDRGADMGYEVVAQ